MKPVIFAGGNNAEVVGSGNITIGLPPGWSVDDIFIIQTIAFDNVVCSFPAGWTILNGTNNTTSVRVTVAWKRAVSGETDPVAITHTAGGTIDADISAWRGASGKGSTVSPFSVVGTPSANASSTTITANAITPNAGDTVIFLGASQDASASTITSNVTNPILRLAQVTVVLIQTITEFWGQSLTGTATLVNTLTDSNAGLNVGQLLAIMGQDPVFKGGPHFSHKQHHSFAAFKNSLKFQSYFRRVVAAGGTTYNQAVSGALSFVGAYSKSTRKPVAGGLSFVGVFNKFTQTARTGGLSFVGAFGKRTGRSQTGGLSFVGTQSKQTNKTLTGGLSFVGAYSKLTLWARAASLSFVGAFSKKTSRALTGGLSFSAAFTASHLFFVALTAVLSFVGGITRLVGKPQTGSLSFSGTTNKLTFRSLTGGVSFVGNIAKLTLKAPFTAALTFVGTWSRVLLKIMQFTASLSFSGAFSKQTNKPQTASLSFSGAQNKLTSKALAGVLSFTGAIAKLTSRLQAAALSFSGAINKLTKKPLVGGMSFSGLLEAVKSGGAHLYTQALSATLSFSGTMGKMTKRGFTATLGTIGSGIGPNIAIVSGRIAKRIRGIIYEDID